MLVAVLDQQPVLARAGAGFGIAALHVHQHPFALHALAVEPELEITILEPGMGIAERLPGARVPEHDGAAAILALGHGALEIAIVARMVLDAHRPPLVSGGGGGAPGDRTS